jgi:hypothetical protein
MTRLQKKYYNIYSITNILYKEKLMSLKENFNLYDLGEDMMSKSKMEIVLAGRRVCGCACYYANTPGGSSIEANCNANYYGGLNGLVSPYPSVCFRDEYMSDPAYFNY